MGLTGKLVGRIRGACCLRLTRTATMGATGVPAVSSSYQQIEVNYGMPPPAGTQGGAAVPGDAPAGAPPPGEHRAHSSRLFGLFEAPVTSAYIGPVVSALQNARPWQEEPFPFAWFLTPIPDLISPDSLVYIAGYEPSGLDKAFVRGNRATPDSPETAAKKTVALGAALIGLGALIMLFPVLPTILILRVGGAALVVAAGFLIYFSFAHSLPDFFIGVNLVFLGLIFIFFRGFGGFLLANMIAGYLGLKGIFRSCPCLSFLAGFGIIVTSMFTSTIIGFLLGWDMLLCGLRVFATGKSLSASGPPSLP